MSDQSTETEWTARHARTRPSERRAPVVRVEAEADDWARRHAETSR
jgi:hypothetical protein